MDAKIDVSQIVWLRQRLGRAQFALKFAGIQAGLVLAGYSLRWLDSFPFVGFGVFVALLFSFVWAGFRLAKGLRRGSESAPKILAWGLIPYASFCLYQVVLFLGKPTPNLGSALSIVLWVSSTYCLVRGLAASRAVRAAMTTGVEPPLMQIANPWETTAKIHRPKAFSKRSLAMFGFLLLVPLPYLYAWFVAFRAEPHKGLGEEVGGAIAVFLTVVPLTTFLYRRARRHAVRRATDIGTQHDQPIALYLRSFGDDKIKLRGRRANGRSWLESVFKIRFEEIIVDHLFRYGPVVAVGRPGEQLPPLGAARAYLTDDEWQGRVEQLMGQARVIVLMAGRTEGLGWELRKIVQLDLSGKLILFLPPVGLQELRSRWDHTCDHIMHVTGTAAPREINLKRTRAILLRRAAAPFSIEAEDSNDYSYEVALDAAVELMVRAERTDLGSEALVWSNSRLAGVPTSRTDWIGRIVRGSFFALIVWAILGFVEFIAFIIGDVLPGGRSAPIFATIQSTLYAAIVWLWSARWFPGVNLERVLLTALAFLPIPTLLFGHGAVQLLTRFLRVLYSVSFAVKRDRMKYG